MAQIFTDRLLLMECPLDLAKSIILNRKQLEERSPIFIPLDWPSIQLKSIFPYYIEMLENSPLTNDLKIWLIIDAYEKKLIGSIRLTCSLDDPKTTDIGYEIIASSRNQGFGYEAVQAVVEWLLKSKKGTKITAECDQTNTASIRILEKLGMRCIAKEAPFLRWELH
ncbi:MAG TPA: GNAT family N-acetyltransferase [Bacillales bacterium]|nr:GNAT family N-acetyltransferase [Bacillales bacterium]